MKRFLTTLVCSALGLIGTCEFAVAEMIGRSECGIIGSPTQEPIGDRAGHSLVSVQYSCVGVDGLLKGAMYTASNIAESEGPKGAYLSGSGVYRTTGGLAVTEITEGSRSPVMKDGKAIGSEASGKGKIIFASGTLAALSGKTFKFATQSTGYSRFSLEMSD